jgi:PelA/Pel-15E family pectate lyase
MKGATAIGLILSVLLCAFCSAQATKPSVDKLTNQPDEWFTADGKTIVENVLTWQNLNGGWWKHYEVTEANKEPVGANGKKSGHDSGFDNGATYSELRIVARAFRVTKDAKYKDSFDRGLKFTLDAQYPNGGWPQRLPIRGNYSHQITFNDDAMTNVMWLLNDIVDKKPDFAFVSDDDRARCKAAFDRGVQCILACQIKVNGKLTAWCQQHDSVTLAPTNARAYELPSICSFESAGIVTLLMSIDNPDPKIRESVDAAMAWFDSSKIIGKHWERVRKPGASKVSDVIFADDPNAPPVWARYYDLETNKPFFCDRDGVKRDSLDEIGKERRLGYAWYNYRPNDAIAAYAEWKKHVGN